MWISDAIGKDLIQPSRAAHHSGGVKAASEWLLANYYNIPNPLRPPKDSIEEFAAFFSTYLASSFDVTESPGTKGEGPAPRFGCRCDLCMRIVNAPHLRAKKLYARDKRRADLLMSECVQRLATQYGFAIDDTYSDRIVADPSTRRAAAYITYGHWLIQRLRGISDGPAILALWRLIAWDPRGGMRTGFTLQLDDVKAAEQTVLIAIESTK